MGKAPTGHGSRRNTTVVLCVGLVGVLINTVDGVMRQRVAPHDAFPLLLSLWAGAELLKGRRPRARRVLRGAAVVVTVAAGLAAGIPAADALVRGEPVDWLDLALGVCVVLGAALGGAALVGRLRARATVAP